MDVKVLCQQLAKEIRQAVRPHLGRLEARSLMGIGAGGYSTFAIDEVAEKILEDRLKDYPELGWFSEDRGLQGAAQPETVLMVDPIDGTRPAAAGLEACCVSVAAAHYRAGGRTTMGDVFFGYLCEIKADAEFYASRGKGARAVLDGVERVVDMRQMPGAGREVPLSQLFWTIGFRGRPAMPLILTLGELIDTSSVDGGLFDLGSATYCITRLLTGQLDSYVDVGDLMAREVPAVKKEFLKVGHGQILNNSAYDLAAAALIAREAGVIVSDAAGGDIDAYPLIDGGKAVQLSCVCSNTQALHDQILGSIQQGMVKLRDAYGRKGRDAR